MKRSDKGEAKMNEHEKDLSRFRCSIAAARGIDNTALQGLQYSMIQIASSSPTGNEYF